MASLVGPLVAGISTAASGSVEFYRRATATLAAVYSDSEGETQVTTHALDARGAIVRYVEERVDVLVRDAGGAEVLQFTWGTDARDARVENLGFTGPNETGQIVPGGRLTVDDALTRLFESLGATDGQVLVNGEVQSLSEAISSGAGVVYNVKSYEAVGDGVANDAPEIQAALNAAAAAGGGIIYFPNGRYLCNSAMSVADGEGKFFFLGESSSGVTLVQGTSGTTLLDLGDENHNQLMGITFEPSSGANTGTLISAGADGRTVFIGCAFGALNGAHIDADVAHDVTLLGCTFTQAGASSRMLTGSSYRARLLGCTLATGAGCTSFDDGNVAVVGCRITMGSAVASSTAVLHDGATSDIQISGGTITNAFASGSVTLSTGREICLTGARLVSNGGAVLTLAGSSTSLREAGCSFPNTQTQYAPGGDPDDSTSQWRDHRRIETDNSTTTYTPDGGYAVHELVSDGASMAFANPSPAVWVGSRLTLIYQNASAGTITPTFGTDYSFDGGAHVLETFRGRVGAGAITAGILRVGDVVLNLSKIGPTAGDVGDAAASFEGVITVAGQIQQSSASDLTAIHYAVLVARPVSSVSPGNTAIYEFAPRGDEVTSDLICTSVRYRGGTDI